MKVKLESVVYMVTAAMIVGISGCATVQPAPQPQQCDTSSQTKQVESPIHQYNNEQEERRDPAEIHISAASALLQKGDIDGALRENQKALTLAGKESPADKAIYNIGLIYLHYKNAQKNYEKARAQFERIIKEYPDSPLVEEARIWSGVLQVIEKLKQVDIDIEQKKEELSR